MYLVCLLKNWTKIRNFVGEGETIEWQWKTSGSEIYPLD